jgi:hypothetical protein
MILGTIYVVCSIKLNAIDADFFDADPITLITLSFASFCLACIDIALKAFLCTLICKIRQLIKENNEEPEDC